MLRELRVRDYALIESLDLELSGGFVAFTGETGAGKSIVIGALALALGGRSQPEQLRSGAGQIVVEARFEGNFGDRVESLLEEAGLQGAGGLLVRRTVPASGKSRGYVNDSAVSLQTLEVLGRELVDIHGQHQHQSLLRPETHLDFLDGFGRLLGRRRRFGEMFGRWNELRRERAELAAREGEKVRRLDFLAFQREEIEKAGIRLDEEEELAARREVLRHAGRLAEGALEAEQLVYSGDHPAAEAVHRAARCLGDLAGVDPGLEQYVRLLEEVQLQLEEAGREIQDYQRRLETDPVLLEQVEERLSDIGRLKAKYGGTVGNVLERLEEIREEIARIDAGGERLAQIEGELPALEKKLVAEAAALSGKRGTSRKGLEKGILGELGELSLGGSTFEVALERPGGTEDDIEVDGRKVRADERGIDRAEFLVSTNPGEPLKPLARVASGGELSRIMLAIKTVLAGVDQVPTLVFDEVDIGIGGRTARLVGERLRGLAAGRQVLCVTHLPQIASLADTHYNISKRAHKGRTVVTVKRLEGPERVDEIARMLGGHKVTDTTRRHARELLGQGS